MKLSTRKLSIHNYIYLEYSISLGLHVFCFKKQNREATYSITFGASFLKMKTGMRKKIIQILEPLVIRFLPDWYKAKYYKNANTINWNNWTTQNAEPLYIKHFLNNEDVFLDVGANLGEFTWLASKHVKPENIYAFEPIPAMYNRLKVLFKKNKIHQIALSNTNGISEFKIPIIAGKTYNSRGTLNVDFVETDEEKSIKFNVKTQLLDSFCDEQKLSKIDFIKIDVEGFEENVVKGAEKSIAKFLPTLYIEIEQRHHEKNAKDIITYITNTFMYSCFYFDANTKSFIEFTADSAFEDIQKMEFFKTNPAKYINNFFFIPTTKIQNGFINNINIAIEQEVNAKRN